MTLVTLSSGVFPAIAGYVFDNTGSYDAMLPFLVALLALPSFAIGFMPRYRFQVALIRP